jgi:hypothetical protein
MQVGIVVLIIIGALTLGQLFVQRLEWRKEHREILDKLSSIEDKLAR